jgi:hypothetical protein
VNSQLVVDIVLGIVVLGLLIYRQMVARPVRSSALRLTLILGVIGVIETVQFLDKHHHSGGVVYAALGGSLVLAIVFGALRAWTAKLWMQGGVPWTQGTWLTAVLWVLALGAHLGYDAILDHNKGTNGLGTATIVLYLAITLAVQRGLLLLRTQRMDQTGSAAPFSNPDSGAARYR